MVISKRAQSGVMCNPRRMWTCTAVGRFKLNFLGNCSSFERAADSTSQDVVAAAPTQWRDGYRGYWA
jgi:hypothetical protein